MSLYRRLAEAIRTFGRGRTTHPKLQAEVELRRSQERFARVFAESPIGIMIHNAEGQQFGPGEAFVQKPFTPDTLPERMRQMLDSTADGG